MFSLWLERAECEFVSGNFETAEQLIGELLQRAGSKVDRAAVYHLKVQFHVVKSEYQQAVVSALTSLRLFGFDLPAHPAWEQVQSEYESIWQALGGRPIESLIDLPLMNDPELQAGLQVLSVLAPPPHTSPTLNYIAYSPHGEGWHAARDERCFHARLRPSRVYPGPGLSSLR